MQNHISRTFGTLLVVLLLAPAGVLFASEQNPPARPRFNSDYWLNTQQATNLIYNIQNLAVRVTNEVGPIQAEEIELPWQAQASALTEIRDHVNEMSDDLFQLSEARQRLEPWQQKLLRLLTPRVHELVYQTRAAVKEIDAEQSSSAMALTEYPKNLSMIARQSNQIFDSVGTFSGYQAAKAKLAHLERHSSRAAS